MRFNINKSKILLYTLLVLLGCGANATLWAFGQNKVQYEKFDWMYLQTKHFDIYYAQDGQELANWTAGHVEAMFDDLTIKLGHKLGTRIPIILHNNHGEFEQTNVVRFPLHEAIGGFTEAFKNRIVLPFEGNYNEFAHVLKHEMVHAFVYDMMASQGGSRLAASGRLDMPLWVSEGMAEYLSQGWDLGSEYFLLDATTSGYITSPVNNFGGFMAYKGGQSFLHFMDLHYGEASIREFLHNILSGMRLDVAFKKVTHISLEEAGELWLRELRSIYWPELGQRQHGKSIARRLTEHGRDLSFYNLQPAISPDGKKVAFFSDREVPEGIFLLDLKTEKVTSTVLIGGIKGQHESFHSFKSGIAWSSDSKRMMIVSKKGGRDVLQVIDVKKGRVVEEIAPEVPSILSPSWSRDGRYIAFSGRHHAKTDIYIWDRTDKKLIQLTNDYATDDKPAFSPSGNFIVFESNRTGLSGTQDSSVLHLYKIDLASKNLSVVAHSSDDDKMPTFGPSDSLLIYISNRSGVDNLYLASYQDSNWTHKPLTNLLAGTFTPSWSRDGKKLIFSLFEFGGWDLFMLDSPLKKALSDTLPLTHYQRMKISGKPYYSPIINENLTSYEKDSVKADEKEKGKKKKHKKENAQDSLKNTIKIDSVKTDSIAVSATKNDTLVKKDSLLDSTAALLPDSLVKLTKPLTDSLKKDSTMIAKTDSAAKALTDSIWYTDGPDSTLAKKLWLDSNKYLKADGTYLTHPYTSKWSLDMASMGVGVSNFEGSFGQGYLVFSDLMGDQEIQTTLNLAGSFSNSAFALYYSYLPFKIDYTVGGYYRAYEDLYWYQGGERTWGFGGTLVYPTSIFNRFTLQLSQNSLTRFNDFVVEDTIIDIDTIYQTRLERETRSASVAYPELTWSFDNALWGITGPAQGTRAIVRGLVVPPAFGSDLFFWTGDVDARHYFLFRKRYTFAMRVNAGMSEGIWGHSNPQQYYLGGDDFFTIYASRWSGGNPKSDPLESVFFGDFGVPLRGYPYFEFSGTRKILANAEFRFPFIQQIQFAWPLPINITYLMGTIFMDYGTAWDKMSEWRDEQGLSSGYGLRLNLGNFVLRWTRAWPIDGVGDHDKSRQDYWSLGTEF